MNESALIRALKALAAFVLCLCLFVTAMAGVLIAGVRSVVSEENVKKIMTQTMFGHAVNMPKRGVAGTGMAGTVSIVRTNLSPRSVRLAETEGSTGMIVDFLYGQLKEQFGDELPITQEQVEQFLDEADSAKEFITEKAADIVNDVMTGESSFSITSDEIKQVLEDSKDLIQEHFDLEITREQIDSVVDSIAQSEVLEKIQTEGINKIINDAMGDMNLAVPDGLGAVIPGAGDELNITDMMGMLRTVTSTTTLVSILAVCLVIMGLLALMYRKRIHIAMVDSGVTLLLVSLITLLPSAAVSLLPDMGAGSEVVMGLLKQVLGIMGTVSIYVLVVAVLLIAGAIVLKAVAKKKAAQANA